MVREIGVCTVLHKNYWTEMLLHEQWKASQALDFQLKTGQVFLLVVKQRIVSCRNLILFFTLIYKASDGTL